MFLLSVEALLRQILMNFELGPFTFFSLALQINFSTLLSLFVDVDSR
jgi:hypothetical protein